MYMPLQWLTFANSETARSRRILAFNINCSFLVRLAVRLKLLWNVAVLTDSAPLEAARIKGLSLRNRANAVEDTVLYSWLCGRESRR